MKKVLVGCGVFLLLAVVGVVGGVLYLGSVAKEVGGGLMEATATATNMSLDRMEQDATVLEAVDLQKRLAQLNKTPVRLTGSVLTPKGPDGAAPPGFNEGALMFLAPNVMVMGLGEDVLPRKRPDGTVVEVLGIAGSVNLAALPGMNPKARQQLVDQLGGTDLPVVVARKVTLVER